MRDSAAKQYFFHGDMFIGRDRIIASADVDPKTGVEAGVHAFDRNAGNQVWKYSAGRGVLGAVVGLGERVFAYTATGDLVALDITSGKSDWTYALNASAWESPAVADTHVFAGSNDGSVYAFDSQTGRVQWHRKLATPVATSVRATASDVYAGTADGTLHRLAANSGEVRSSLNIDTTLKLTSAPVITKNAIFVLLADKDANYRGIVALDPALTRVKWRQTATDRWTTSRLFVTARAVFVGSPTGEVTAYCAADGSPVWSHKLTTGSIRSIGGTDEMLFVGTPQGSLYAIRPPRSCQ